MSNLNGIFIHTVTKKIQHHISMILKKMVLLTSLMQTQKIMRVMLVMKQRLKDTGLQMVIFMPPKLTV